jgi:hypothetical protein
MRKTGLRDQLQRTHRGLRLSRLLHGDDRLFEQLPESGERALYYHAGAEFPLGVGELNLKLGAGFNDISAHRRQ